MEADAISNRSQTLQASINQAMFLPTFFQFKAPMFQLKASARLAQSAERKALNLVVVGSSPTVGVLPINCEMIVQTAEVWRKMCGVGKMDTLGFEPRAFRMRSGCDTTTPCALEIEVPDKSTRKLAESRAHDTLKSSMAHPAMRRES